MKNQIKLGIKDERDAIKYYKDFNEEELTKEEIREIKQAEKDEKKHLKWLKEMKHDEELGRLK